jgi:hypothetical protein
MTPFWSFIANISEKEENQNGQGCLRTNSRELQTSKNSTSTIPNRKRKLIKNDIVSIYISYYKNPFSLQKRASLKSTSIIIEFTNNNLSFSCFVGQTN